MRAGESGLEKIPDEAAKSELPMTARRIQVAAPLIGLALTAVALWLARSMS
jgi:hypothetical protein